MLFHAKRDSLHRMACAAKQLLQRWRHAQLGIAAVVERVLQAAGIVAPPEGEGAGGPEQGPAQTEGQGTLRKALGMLMLNAGESAAGESLPIAAQAEALVTVLSAFASRRMLIICVEDAEHMPVSSFSSHPLSFLYGKHWCS